MDDAELIGHVRERKKRERREARRKSDRSRKTKYDGIRDYPARVKRYRAFVDRDGHKLSRGFTDLEEANEWKIKQEASIIDTGSPLGDKKMKDKTVEDIVEFYYDNVVYPGWDIVEEINERSRPPEADSVKRRYVTEKRFLDKFLGKKEGTEKHYLCDKPIFKVTKGDGRRYVQERQKEPWQGPAEFRWKQSKFPVGATIKKDISILSRAFELFKEEYPRAQIINPFHKLQIDGKQHSRTPRRLEEGELEKLLEACKGCVRLNKLYVPLAILIAVETGMRQGEIFNLRRGDIDDNSKEEIHIRQSKTDYIQEDPGRTIPLTAIVELALDKLEATVGKIKPQNRLFGRLTQAAFNASWKNVRRWAKLEKPLAFHDLRHEAISRFDKILTATEGRWMAGHAPKDIHEKYKKVPNREDIKLMKQKLDNARLGLPPDAIADALGRLADVKGFGWDSKRHFLGDPDMTVLEYIQKLISK
jgi:integrase